MHIASAIQWVIETKDQYNTKVLNLSLGSPANSSVNSDPLVKAVDEAVKSGLTVVVAAGNSGPGSKTILSPGNSPAVITVGAVDDKRTPETDDDTIASFSSRGPTKEGLRKPDVVAPGVNIMSLSNSSLDNYAASSGTSMATPVVAGSAALLYSKHKNLSPEQVKTMFKNSCHDLKDKYENQGSGIVDLNKLFEEPLKERPPKAPPKSSPKEDASATFGLFNENIIIVLLVILLLVLDFK
ncbi:S8 family serine peptidase [Brassicibacter mesophilus]|uniref:S8 family serine peptidase n=1 Tax=Brassicibacter mesophilus TaxID=745119 RepID=UPI003D23DEB0